MDRNWNRTLLHRDRRALIYDRGLIKCCWAGRRWNRIRSAEAPLVPSAGFDRSVTTNLSALSASKASHAISSI